jgi:serine/threonine-protein kinase
MKHAKISEAMMPSVLFVDDEPRVLRTLKLMFGKTYNVFLAEGGEQALDILKTNDIQVIVCDQRMPKMLGVEVLKKALTISPNTMRMLLTGYSENVDIINSINDAEIFRYILKPWDNNHLKALIEKAIHAAESTASTPAVALNPTLNSANTSGEILGIHSDILLIEDDPAIYGLVKKVYSSQGTIYCATNIEMALSTMEMHPDIALIVSELFVDDEEVTNLLTVLKSHYPQILSLVLTRYHDTEKLFRLINEGQIFRFLLKPTTEKMLKISLSKGIQRHQAFLNNKQLLERHKVEAPKQVTDTNSRIEIRLDSLLKRVTSIFRRKAQR